MRVADTKRGKTCASESPALLAGRGFAYHAPTLTTHRSNVCCVFLCVLPEDCWAKEKLLAVWENPISILHSFFFPPRRPCAIHKIHAQTARIPCAFWGNTFWWSLFYIPDLFINMTLCHPQPIPVENLLVEDLSDGDARMGGSFKTAISRLGTGE